MSNTAMPVIPPIPPSEAEKANRPEPESERAEREKTAKAERLIQGEPPTAPEPGSKERIKEDRELAKARGERQ
jgi:hypothetical protein